MFATFIVDIIAEANGCQVWIEVEWPMPRKNRFFQVCGDHLRSNTNASWHPQVLICVLELSSRVLCDEALRRLVEFIAWRRFYLLGEELRRFSYVDWSFVRF